MIKSRFFTVYLMTFINVLSFSLLIPVFPFLVKIYSQPEIMLGIFAACYSFFQLIGAPIIGSLSDKYGRRPVLIATQGGTLLSWILLGSAYLLENDILFGFVSLPIIVILLSRMFDGITGGNQSVINAMIGDLSTKEERTKIFGLNGAVIGIGLIVGPSLGAFAMSTSLGYLATAMLGAFVSFLAFLVLVFLLKESLKEENKSIDIEFNFKKLNIFSQAKKYIHKESFRFGLLYKVLFNGVFMVYTTISIMYLIDVFGFSELKTGFYMIVTGSFFIFHQMFSVGYLSGKLSDVRILIIGFFALFSGYLGMGFSDNIFIYTFFYFFSILGIALGFSSLQSIFSKGATEKQQGEIMGIYAGIESFLAIIFPILGAYIYQITDISIFKIISVIPFAGIVLYFLYFRKKLKSN